MIIALCAVLAVAVVVLVTALVRTRRSVEAHSALEQERSQQLQGVQEALREAEVASQNSSRERDEALERVQRARRDAAEVAKRLSDLTAQHDELSSDHSLLAEEHEALAKEYKAVCADRESVAIGPEGSAEAAPLDSDVVWALTLARLDRLWHVSVAPGTEAVSPLMTSESVLEDALGVVVDAAREEAGAIVDLTFEGDHGVDGAASATVVCLVEELVAASIAIADETTVVVAVEPDAVFVTVSAESDDEPVVVPGPTAFVGPDGRYRVELSSD